MAITFEKKNNASKIVFVIVFCVVILAVGGYFAWKIFFGGDTVISVGTASVISIKTEVFNDPRINNLELFPQIPVPTMPIIDLNGVKAGRENPFAESTDETNAAATKDSAAAIDSKNITGSTDADIAPKDLKN
jgi:hypothetical protein